MSDSIGAVSGAPTLAASTTSTPSEADLIQAFSQAALAGGLSLTQSFIGDTIDAIQDTSADPDGAV